MDQESGSSACKASWNFWLRFNELVKSVVNKSFSTLYLMRDQVPMTVSATSVPRPPPCACTSTPRSRCEVPAAPSTAGLTRISSDPSPERSWSRSRSPVSSVGSLATYFAIHSASRPGNGRTPGTSAVLPRDHAADNLASPSFSSAIASTVGCLHSMLSPQDSSHGNTLSRFFWYSRWKNLTWVLNPSSRFSS